MSKRQLAWMGTACVGLGVVGTGGLGLSDVGLGGFVSAAQPADEAPPTTFESTLPSARPWEAEPRTLVMPHAEGKAALLDASRALAAFEAARAWVNQGQVGEAGASGEADANDPATWTGVRVTLRIGNSTLGRGRVVDPGGDGPAMLRAAVGEAIESMRERLPSRAAAERLAELGRATSLELELLGPLEAIARDKLDEPTTALRPGLDGVGARVGNRFEALFPGELCMMGTAPGRAFGSVVARLTEESRLGLMTAATLADERDVVFYRCRSSHVVELEHGTAPRFLHRGGRVVEGDAFDAAALERFAERLAAHLSERLRRGPDLENEQAWLAAYALQRHAAGGPASAEVGSMLDRVRLHAPRSLASRALATVVARDALGDDAPGWVGDALQAWREDDVLEGETGVGLLMVAWALAETGASHESVAARLRRVFEATPGGAMVGAMPFVGWAVRAMPPEHADVFIERLAAVRAMVWDHQVGPGDVSVDDRDLLGGVTFTRGGARAPTWHTARPLAFLAGSMLDERLVAEDERIGELSRVLRGLRFLRQLAADESAYSSRMVGALPWGVRSAVWETTQPLAASALTLIAVDEARRAAGAMGGIEPLD